MPSALSEKSEENDSRIGFLSDNARKEQALSTKFKLGWSHYQVLMRIENEAARSFYEIEAMSQQWSVKQLQRQVGSSLYERLRLSRDKDRVMALANEGQVIENSRDIFKTPYVLEFTGLEERTEYSETELEQALIDNLQKFLLELGKGFLFEARQKRFSFDEKSFYVDLVFYNRLLQYYVLIDLKVNIKTWAKCRCTSTTLTVTPKPTPRSRLLAFCYARKRTTVSSN
jgi:predicted nuclease of restriction endonuclease-like (RecB) superfamily